MKKGLNLSGSVLVAVALVYTVMIALPDPLVLPAVLVGLGLVLRNI